jgi:hypothetical protein
MADDDWQPGPHDCGLPDCTICRRANQENKSK